nr:MAG TPA: Protein of unknown function (DUF4087) [Bacteriophage sp.]
MSANHNPLPGNIWVGDFFMTGAWRRGGDGYACFF